MNMNYSGPVLQLSDLRRSFRQGTREIHVLAGASVDLYPGQAIALVGPSGTGKSTLSAYCGPARNTRFRPGHRQRARLHRDGRRRAYPRAARGDGLHLSVSSAVARVLGARERSPATAHSRPRPEGSRSSRQPAAVRRLVLAERLDHRPAQLSGGEQQRTAICRALANQPRLILADEPTGNLDPRTSEVVFQELIALFRSEGVAALIATHNLELARRMDRVVKLESGLLVEVAPSSLF